MASFQIRKSAHALRYQGQEQAQGRLHKGEGRSGMETQSGTHQILSLMTSDKSGDHWREQDPDAQHCGL